MNKIEILTEKQITEFQNMINRGFDVNISKEFAKRYGEEMMLLVFKMLKEEEK